MAEVKLVISKQDVKPSKQLTHSLSKLTMIHV